MNDRAKAEELQTWQKNSSINSEEDKDFKSMPAVKVAG